MKSSIKKIITCIISMLLVLTTVVSTFPSPIKATGDMEYQNLFNKDDSDNWLQALTYDGTKLFNPSAYANMFTTHKIMATKGDTLTWGIAGKDLYVLETYDQNDQVVDRQVRSQGNPDYIAQDLDTKVTCSGGLMLNEAIASYKISSERVAYVRILGNISTMDNFMVFKNLPNGLADWPSTYIAFEKVVDPENPLNGQSAIFFGDSITDCTYKDPDHPRWGWAGRIGTKNNMLWKNAGSDGATIADAFPANPGNRIIKELNDNTQSYDYVIMHGGMNDSLKQNPIGEISDSFDIHDFDVHTMSGALEELFYTATKQYSASKIGYIINYATPNATWGGDTANNEAYFNRIKEICRKWNIPYIDLFSGGVVEDGKFQSYSLDILKLDSGQYLYGNDKGEIHIGSKGYDIITPYIETWMKSLSTYTNKYIETIIDDSKTGSGSNEITYTGKWIGGANGNCYDKTEHYTRYIANEEQSFRMKFTGSKVELYGGKDAGHGIYEVFIDGVTQGYADAYGSSRSDQQLLFSSNVLENSEHEVKVVLTGKKNAQALRNDGHIDAIKVYEPQVEDDSIHIISSDFTLQAGESKPLTARIRSAAYADADVLWHSENSDVAGIDAQGVVHAESNGTTAITASIAGTDIVSLPVMVSVTGNDIAKHVSVIDDMTESSGFSFTYDGTWNYDQGYPALFYKGTNHWSTAALQQGSPVTATLVFAGPSVEVYGNLQSDQGIYEFYLDGELVGEKDAYSANRLTQQLLFEHNGLTDEEHTLNIVSTNRKNEKSSGTSISIDYAKVYFNDILATDFTIAQTNVTLDTGSEFTLSTIYSPSYANIYDITWSSSDESIAVVDANGTITAKKAGSVEITGVLANGKKKTAKINVIDANHPLHVMFGNTNIHYYQKNYDDIVKRYAYESSYYNTDFAWKNDEINAEIVTFTKNKAVNNVTVQASDFVNEHGTVFSSDHISINFLRETSVGDGRGGNIASSNHSDVPDIIYKNDPIDMPEKRIQSAWMNIEVPTDCEPGIYQGVVMVEGEDMDSISLPYTFEVIDLIQPDVQDYQGGIELWEYPYAVAKYYDIPDSQLYGEKHISLLEKNLKEYAQLGGNTITTAITEYPWDRNNPYDYPSTIKWTKKTDGTFSFDYRQFDAWVSLNLAYGIDDKLKCFSMAPYHSMVYYDEAKGRMDEETLAVGSERWKQVWGQFLNSFIPHLDEKGWFDMTYTAMDEVGQTQINAIYELLQNYTNKDGKHLKVAAAVNYGGTTQATLDRVDDISIALSHVGSKTEAQAIANDRREKGLYTSFYTCTGIYPNSFGLSDPGESAWTFWYNAASGMDGFLRWAYDNWLYTPYTSLDWKYWEAGDTMMIYPEEDKTVENPQIYTTPRWEKLKEGKRDIEKMYYLQDHYESLREDVKTTLTSVEKAQGVTNSNGGVYAANQAAKDKTSNEVIRMRAALKNFSMLAVQMDNNHYTIEVEKNIEEAGVVTGADDYVGQQEVTLTAEAKEGYTFVNWTKDGVEVSRDATYTFIVSENAVYCANFMKLEQTSTMKDILKKSIDKAERIATNEYLETLAPNVAAMIQTRIHEAKGVYEDVNATNEACMEAWLHLANALHYLDFVANKTDLADLIALCESIDTTGYVSGVEAFERALTKAQEVYADDMVLQDSINAAFQTLMQAKDALVKEDVDKTILRSVVSYITDIVGDGSKYKHDHTWEIFQTAFNNAAAILADENATQEQINQALFNLTAAYTDIRLLPDETLLALLSDFLRTVDQADLRMYHVNDVSRILNVRSAVATMLADPENMTEENYEALQPAMAEVIYILAHGKIEKPTDMDTTLDPTQQVDSSTPNKSEDSINGTIRAGTTKTGDVTKQLGLSILLMASAGIVVGMHKKQKKN